MSVGKFLKENIVLVMGLTLPVILILLFFVAAVVPKWLAPPPQYPVLFTSSRYDYETRPPFQTDFFVSDGVLKVRVAKANDKNQTYQARKLMLYDGKNDSVREIAYDSPKLSALAEAGGGEMVLGETQQLRFDTAFRAPDGYEFEGAGYHGGGLAQELFGGGYRNRKARLKKGATVYKISIPAHYGDYYYGDVRFIGWVVKQ